MTDVKNNRTRRKWTRIELAKRVLWSVAHPLFRMSPRPMWGWRRMILRLFGAKIGKNVHIYPSARIIIPWNLRVGEECAIGDRVTLYALGLITIGDRSTISQNVHLCAGTHDWRDPSMPLIKSNIDIGRDVWICADAFVGPGVTIDVGAIVAARAVAVKNIGANDIVGGNPAKIIGTRDS